MAALRSAGAAGCNLEDTDHAAGSLRDPDRHAEWLRAVRRAASEDGYRLVINARVDVPPRSIRPSATTIAIVQHLNDSDQEQFERLHRRIWSALMKPDDPDLSHHERLLLHHVPAGGAISLTELARHLALPKSSASVVVKSLARRGFLVRARDEGDERRLRIALTDEGRARVEADTVLEPERLSAALARLSQRRRRELLRALEDLAREAEGLG